MLLFERSIAGLVGYRKVFFASEAQLAELVRNLRPFSILRAFSSAVLSNSIHTVVQSRGKTALVDLSKGPKVIYASMHPNCRYKIRRAGKMRNSIDIAMNTEAARQDFLTLNSAFARSKGMPSLTARRFNEYHPRADVFVLYFEGRPTCGRLTLRDEQSRTALMMFSPTCRLDQGADTITIGLLNRYLYWHEIKTYLVAGFEKYDFGGAGGTIPSLTQFKLSFGAQPSTVNYAVYAGSARLAWKLAHSWYQACRDRRRDVNRSPWGEMFRACCRIRNGGSVVDRVFRDIG